MVDGSLSLPDASLAHVRPDLYKEILNPGAIAFVNALVREFRAEVSARLEERNSRQRALDSGELPDFRVETASIRASSWTVAAIPLDLLDRRVEITGPPERKMLINALNSGAKVFMADCEDSSCPTWANVIGGQINLLDAVTRRISLDAGGKQYRLSSDPAVLMVRPRGWHLPEKHWILDGEAAPGALVDFGLFLYHNHSELTRRGAGPYFYLPKLESYLEARLWAEVFRFSERALSMPPGSIKCTVLIETILAAFEMDEILYELRDHIVGLNCGRWDYIFSFIKKFASRADCVLPDRHQIGMTTHFLRSYSQLLIQTCHRRGAFAMGGMAAQIPIKGDPAANELALGKVRADKEREVGDGHDGTWVAHPALVPVAQSVFDRGMTAPNQLHVKREDVRITASDLLRVPSGTITEAGLRNNVSVAFRYIVAWLGGNGCVPLYNLMEDAATAELSRAQLWQWVHHRCAVADGRAIDLPWVQTLIDAEALSVREERLSAGLPCADVDRAAAYLSELTASERIAPFLTNVLYEGLSESSVAVS